MNNNIEAGADIHSGDGGYSEGTQEKYQAFVKNRNRMNDRIKEITGQVLDEIVPETWTALGYDKIKEIQFRTAELIIKECVRYFNEDYERDFDRLWREDLSKGIKEHFGVRE